MVAAASATATATASVVAMQDRQDIPSQFNQVNVWLALTMLSIVRGQGDFWFIRYIDRYCNITIRSSINKAMQIGKMIRFLLVSFTVIFFRRYSKKSKNE